MTGEGVTGGGLLKELAPQVLGALVRRYGHFDACEDAVQEALLAAATQWPSEGMPDNPRSWLIRVASRRLTDELRSEQARRRREETVAVQIPSGEVPDADDSLILLFLCCHPSLSRASQIALTLRAVGGLTTEEIARALLVPEETMRKRISRAKQTIKSSGVPFRMPVAEDRPDRLAAVLHVLYLIFNEGYTSTERKDLADEAIRLARMTHRLIQEEARGRPPENSALPEDGEVAGLLALMLLTDARRDARTGPDGDLIPLDEQDRTRWDPRLIAEGTELVTDAMSRTRLGPYQIQAAIAAVHDEAATADDTDWPQILALYDLLTRLSDNPMVLLNRAVAVARVRGPRAGLAILDQLDDDPRLATQRHRLDTARAHLLEMTGDLDGARDRYLAAARHTTSNPERRYLAARARRLST